MYGTEESTERDTTKPVIDLWSEDPLPPLQKGEVSKDEGTGFNRGWRKGKGVAKTGGAKESM